MKSSSASDKVRIGQEPANWTKSSFVGVYVQQSEITIGYINVDGTSGAITYYAPSKSEGYLSFIVSLSPKNENSGIEDVEGSTYGTILVTFGNVMSSLPA